MTGLIDDALLAVLNAPRRLTRAGNGSLVLMVSALLAMAWWRRPRLAAWPLALFLMGLLAGAEGLFV